MESRFQYVLPSPPYFIEQYCIYNILLSVCTYFLLHRGKSLWTMALLGCGYGIVLPSVGQLITPCQKWERADAYSPIPISTKLVGGCSVGLMWKIQIGTLSTEKTESGVAKTRIFPTQKDGTQVLTLFWPMSAFIFPQFCRYAFLWWCYSTVSLRGRNKQNF